MATQTSSLIGATIDGSASSATALFALGTVAFGTDGTKWEYVLATATFTTGELVLVSPNGTAKTCVTARMSTLTQGVDLGFCQGLLNRSEYGWIAKQGRKLYILTTATMSAGSPNGLGFTANSGRLAPATMCGVGNTAFGIWVTSNTPTGAGPNVTVATITWPRIAFKG